MNVQFEISTFYSFKASKSLVYYNVYIPTILKSYLNYDLFQIFHPTLHSNSTTVTGEEKCQAVIARDVGSRFNQLISREKNLKCQQDEDYGNMGCQVFN